MSETLIFFQTVTLAFNLLIPTIYFFLNLFVLFLKFDLVSYSFSGRSAGKYTHKKKVQFYLMAYQPSCVT